MNRDRTWALRYPAARRAARASVPGRVGVCGRAWLAALFAIGTGLCLASSAASAAEPPAAFAFVGESCVITAEVSGAHKFVLNFFNLSDFVVVIQPGEFIYQGSSGQFYIGQVFDQPTKSTRGDSYRYSASILLLSNTYRGIDILGAFHEQDSIQELSIRIGAKRFYLDPLNKGQFDQLAAGIEDLDVKTSDPRAAMKKANLTDMGRIRNAEGTSEWDRDWQGLLVADGVNPPRILESPEIKPTEEARRTNTFGKIRLSAIITRDGAVQDLSVLKGLGRGLDERAVEVVKNSWRFLPATKNGEVIETSIKFEVTIAPPKSQSQPVPTHPGLVACPR